MTGKPQQTAFASKPLCGTVGSRIAALEMFWGPKAKFELAIHLFTYLKSEYASVQENLFYYKGFGLLKGSSFSFEISVYQPKYSYPVVNL